MQGVESQDFDGLKGIMEMGFSSTVAILTTINDENLKTRKIVGSILDRLDNLSENIGQTFNTGIGKLGLGSFVNYSKLSYNVQLDIFKSIQALTLLQRKLFDKLAGKKLDLSDFDRDHDEDNYKTQENQRQGALIGGKIINTKTNFEFNLKDTDTKTINSFNKTLTQLNKFMSFKDAKFKLIKEFFQDMNVQLTLLKSVLTPVATGFALLAGSILLLSYASIVNVFKMALILPILGLGVSMFILTILSATKSIGGGFKGMVKFYFLMKMLPDLFISLGKGVVLLSIGLLLFNAVGYDSILKLIGTMISLGIAFKLMTDGGGSFTTSLNLMIIIGVILAISHALIMIKNVKWDSVLKLPVFIGALGLALKIGGFVNMGRIRIMNMLAIALMLITISLIKFKEISWENIIKYNVFISLLGLSIRTIRKDMPIMGVMALAFVALTAALLDFQELNWMSIIQIIGVVGLLGVVINKFVIGKMGSGGSLTGTAGSLSGGGFKGMGLIGFALGLFLLTFAISQFGKISWTSVLKAISIIAVLGLTIKLFLSERTTGILGGRQVSMPSIFGFALGLGILILALDAVSEIEWKSVFQLIAVMVTMGLIFKFLMPQKTKTSGMLGFALGLGILLLALDAMSEIAWENVAKLVVFMTGIAGALWLLKGTGFWQMIAMAGAVYVMVYSLEYLSKIKIEFGQILNFTLFVGSMSLAMMFIGKSVANIALGVAAVLGIGWATSVMSDALLKISNLHFSLEGTLVFAAGVAIIGAAMMGIGMLMMTGVGAAFLAAGAAAVIVIGGASYVMALALSAISKLEYNPLSFVQFGFGIKEVIGAYISLDPIATIASAVTAIATLPILLAAVFAIGVLKLIDFTFGSSYSSAPVKEFTKGLGVLISSFNDSIGIIAAGKGAVKAGLILPILGTMFLASLLLKKINDIEWDSSKMGNFNTMFGNFITSTVSTINEHKDALKTAAPGIKAISQLINVASSLAGVVQNISNLRFVEMGVVNGKVVVKSIRQLGPTDFENVGKSISKLLIALINPIKALGMDTDTWRIGSDVIQNPFKNNTFLNGIDNVKKISDAFKPFVESIVSFTKTGVTTGVKSTNDFTYGVQQTAKAYGYVFFKLAQIQKANLLKDSFKTIDAIKKYNEVWDDLNFDSFQDYSKLFNTFIDRLADETKWKAIHRNIKVLTSNLQKTVKAINSIDLEKAAALEVNVKQLTDKNNVQYLREVVEQFINLFGVIGQAQLSQTQQFQQSVDVFGTSIANQSVAQTVTNSRFKEGAELLDKVKKGETSISINNLTSEEQKIIKDGGYDSNNDGMITNTDAAAMTAVGDKIDKLIAVFQGQTANRWRK